MHILEHKISQDLSQHFASKQIKQVALKIRIACEMCMRQSVNHMVNQLVKPKTQFVCCLVKHRKKSHFVNEMCER